MLLILMFLSYLANSQTATVTIFYSGAQAWGCCSVCGTDYMCIGSSGCGCCQPAQQTKTFMDPIPAGNVVTNVKITYYAADCSAPNVPSSLNGVFVCSAWNQVGNNTCACGSCNPVWCQTGYPCGIPGYVYGGMNTLYSNPPAGTEICAQRVEIILTYSPGGVSAPAAPGAITGPISVCPGQTVTYSIAAVSGATSYTWTVPSGATIVSGQGTTSITVTWGFTSGNVCVYASNSCGNSVQTCVFVTVNASIAISVTPAAPTICSGGSVVLTASGANTYTWSPGTGLSGTTGAVVTANPTTTTTYTVTGTSLAGCTGTTTVTVTVNPNPVISVNPSAPSICSGGSVVLTAGGANTYSWAPGTGLSGTTGAVVTANPTTTTTYTVTGTSLAGCTGTTTVTVTVNPNPVISVNPSNPSICLGSNVVLTASGANTYTWAPGTGLSGTTGAVVTASPTTTTTYTVTGTTLAGCTGTTTVTVSINPSLTITVNPTSPAICNGSSVVLTASGGNTYTWAPGTGLSGTTGAVVTANPTTTTTYTVTGTDLNGCSGTATVMVTVNANPIVLINPSAPAICSGGSVVLTASGANTYSWAPGAGLSGTTGAIVTANPTSTTTYTITGTSTAGCTGTTTVLVTVNPNPVISVNPSNPSICLGSNVVLTASGANTYTWAPGTGLSGTTGAVVTANPTTTTTYTVTGTSIAGCTGTTTVTVSINPNLTVNITPTSAAICNGFSVVLTASGGNTYTWAPGTGLSGTTGAVVTANPTSTTTYTVTGTDLNGCSGTSSVMVTVNSNPGITLGPAAPAICNGASTTLSAAGASNYDWAPATGLSAVTGTSVTANPTSTTTYTVTGTDGNGCTGTATITLTVNPNPVIVINPVNPTICTGGDTLLTASGADNYSWAPATGLSATTGVSVTANPTVTTTYTVTGTTIAGCTGTTTVTVTLNPALSVNITSNDQTICLGQNTIITGSASGGSGGPYTYSWDNGIGVSAPPITVSPTTTTTYNVTVTDNCGSMPATDNITITVSPNPTVSFTASPLAGCSPLDVNFISNCSPAIQTYQWSFDDPSSGSSNSSNAANPSHQFIPSGSYDITLTVTTVDGCSGTITVNNMITVAPKPTADFTPLPSSTTMDNPTISFIDNSSNASSWNWVFGDPASGGSNTSTEQSPSHTYSNQGTYVIWLTVESIGGCSDSISKEITIRDDYTFYAPDAFTPDGDGINDFFIPIGINLDINNFEMHIYNRWGEEIYRTKDMSKPWDGTVKNSGVMATPGVFVWMVKMNDNKGKSHIVYGKVTLLK
jgi:gliding motility-associated-like protein